VQAAGPVSTFGAVLASRAQIAFFDQPNLGKYKLSALHRALDDLLENWLDRTLLRNIEEYLHSQMRIEPFVASRFNAGRFQAGTILTFLTNAAIAKWRLLRKNPAVN